MYGACTVKITALFAALLVHVWCIHDQEYFKEEQQTRATQIDMVSSNKKVVLVNKMVLKATLFWVEKEETYRLTMAFYYIIDSILILLLLLLVCCRCCVIFLVAVVVSAVFDIAV